MKIRTAALICTAVTAGLAINTLMTGSPPADLRDAVADDLANAAPAAGGGGKAAVPVPDAAAAEKQASPQPAGEDAIVDSFLGAYSLVKDGTADFEREKGIRMGRKCSPELLISDAYDRYTKYFPFPCAEVPDEDPQFRRKEGFISVIGLPEKPSFVKIELDVMKYPPMDSKSPKDQCVARNAKQVMRTSFGYLDLSRGSHTQKLRVRDGGTSTPTGGLGIGLATDGYKEDVEISRHRISYRRKAWQLLNFDKKAETRIDLTRTGGDVDYVFDGWHCTYRKQ